MTRREPPTIEAGDSISASISEQIRTPAGDRWLKYEATVTCLDGETAAHARMRLEQTLITGLHSLRSTDEEENR